jgi:tryptophan synthase alpha chain
VTDKPLLVGVGIGSPAQAVEVCASADGVVIGSVVVQRMLEGGGPEGVAALVREYRTALDSHEW